jgi:hypothetical protein
LRRGSASPRERLSADMSTLSHTIDYEALVATYEENLVTVLRGFRPAVGFLETWVPDADAFRSLLSVVEAAEQAGVPEISLLLGQATLAELDLQALERSAARIGRVRVSPSAEGLLFSVSFDAAALGGSADRA